MRAVFSVLGLLVVVAIVGVLAKKQLSAASSPARTSAGAQAEVPAAPRQQVEQFKQGVEGVMQQARPMPDDTK